MDAPNLLLGAPGFSEQVMRALGIKGDLPQDLVPYFGATFQLDNFGAPEYAWARRSSLWEMGAQAPAVAGQLSRVALAARVAAGTQRSVLCCVDDIRVFTPTAGGTGLMYGVDLLGTGIANPTATARFKDDRIFGKAESVFALSAGAAVANPIAARDHSQIYVPQNLTIEIPGPFFLSNVDNGTFASSLLVVGTTGNVDLRVSIQWRERDLLPEEV